ncbi:MAG: SPASM domain-containing protein [Candidatus Methanoperedens sp.]|nr:SPASM domain-containing protein [Candidatus Methanoperedens sp.]MCZ7406493.1 SPASM domain-containing protein [Candidatus Methanoperedens sp.]
MGRYRKQQITFFLTNHCNLYCDYCYVCRQNSQIKKLDINFAKCGINDFFNSNNSRWIRFFAEGEPTLEFFLMKQIRDYAYGLVGDKLRIELQTNGYFSQEIAKWISKNVDMVWFSHDGPNIHDKHRKTLKGEPSSQLIERNILFLAKNENLVVGVRSSISSDNVKNQKEMVDFFSKLGVKAVAVDPIFKKVGSENEPSIDLLDFAKNFLIAKKRADELNIFYTSILTTNFDEKVNIHCQACIPCPHLTPDGFVSACDLATSGNTSLKEFIYGKYNQEKNKIDYFDKKMRSLQSRNTDNLAKCQNCEVLHNCAGGCLGETLNECGNLFEIRKSVCPAIKYLAKNMERNTKRDPYFHP